MRKITAVLVLIFTIIIYSEESDVFYKRIQVTGTAYETFSPDTAGITFVITTEKETLMKASDENARILQRFKKLLSKSGVKYEKIESELYDSYETKDWDSVLKNEGKKEYVTMLNIEITVDNQENLREITGILSAENIDYFSKAGDKTGEYEFSIEESAPESKVSYQKTLNRYKQMETKILKSGLVSKMSIASYDTEENSLEEYEEKEVDRGTVNHRIKIQTRDIKNIGKIINLAFALNIYPEGYIEYDVDNKTALENKLYEKAYREALGKAEKILGKTDLSLKKPLMITDNSTGQTEPVYDYFDSYNNFYEDIDEIAKKSDNDLIKLANSSNLIINPGKITISKTVNIEFQIEKSQALTE